MLDDKENLLSKLSTVDKAHIKGGIFNEVNKTCYNISIRKLFMCIARG